MFRCKIVNVAGYDMEVHLTDHACQRVLTRGGTNLDDVFSLIITTLQNQEVADYLINDVKIGERTVIADLDHRWTFAISMETTSVYVSTAFSTKPGNQMHMGLSQFVIFIKNMEVVFADEFQRLTAPVRDIVNSY